MRSGALGRFASDVAWLLVPAVCIVALMVALGLLVTDVLPSTAFGKWDADVPGRLVDFRQLEGISESKIVTTLSNTSTIVVLTVLTVVAFRWKIGRWRESLVVVYAVVGETAIFMATTLFVERPRPGVPLDQAPPTSSFPSGHTAAAVCYYGSVAAIVVWHSRRRWAGAVAIVFGVAVPLAIAGSRLYRGMHYPTDVLAGALLGVIWLTVVIVFVRIHDSGGHPHAVVDADRRMVTG